MKICHEEILKYNIKFFFEISSFLHQSNQKKKAKLLIRYEANGETKMKKTDLMKKYI